LGSKGQPVRKAFNLTAICEPTVYKMWKPQPLKTLWASTACYRDSFTFLWAWFTVVFFSLLIHNNWDLIKIVFLNLFALVPLFGQSYIVVRDGREIESNISSFLYLDPHFKMYRLWELFRKVFSVYISLLFSFIIDILNHLNSSNLN
jgi:hypothetical protein